MLVEFYAPWCGHCKKLEPEYAKAAQELAALAEPLYIAKLDATEHKEAGQKFEIRGFPTLKLFKKGTPIDYQGGRTAEDIVTYMIKKSGPALTTVASVEEADAFFSKHPKAAIGLFDSLESPAALGLADYAAKFDSMPLAYTKEKAVLSKYSGKANTVHFVTAEGSFSSPLDFSKEKADEELGAWLFGHSISPMFKFSAEKSMELFSGPIRVHLITFADEETKDFEKIASAVKDAAVKHRTKALSIQVAKNETRILEAFDLKEGDVPKIVIADMRGGSMKRFMYEGDVKKSGAIDKFLNDFFKGNLKAKLKSEEPAPEDMAKPVKVLKGKSFKKEVLDSKKDVLVEFYAPWCGHCKSLEPKWDVLGEKFEGVDHVVIAKMDYTANELDVPGIDIKGFPTILFFPAGKKAEPITYGKAREVNDFIDFLKEHSTKPFEVAKEEEVAEEDEDEDEEAKDEL